MMETNGNIMQIWWRVILCR